MALNSLTASPEHIGEIVTKAIGIELEGIIRKKLQEQVDPIISEIARNLAKNTAVNVKSYMQSFSQETFGPEIRLYLSFNNEQVSYEAAGSGERTNVGCTGGSSGQCSSCIEPSGSQC